MSDETPPPSLRLKPRQRTDAEAPPATPPPADGGKLRLKPKLNVEAPAAAPEAPPPAPAESSEPPAAPPPPEKVRLKPKLNQEAPQPAAEAPPEAPPETESTEEPVEESEAEEAPPAPEEPKPKLKIKIPGALSDPPPGAEGDPNVPPPFPVVLAPGAEGVPPPTAGTRPGMSRPGVPVRRVPADVLAKTNRRKKFVKLILVGLGAVALAAGMLKLAMVKFIDPPPPPPSIIPKPRPPVKIAPIVEVPNPPETEAETKVAQPEATTPKPVVKPVKQPKPKSGETTTKATSDLAPGVTVTSDAVQAEVEASSEFRTFVADAKVSGVFQGSPSRAFINGRLVRAGEVVDSALGIKFESVDPSTKTIVFKDSTGAKVAKHY